MPERTVGVEEEFLVVGLDDGRPRPLGDPVVARADSDAVSREAGVEHELKREQVETGTAPRLSLADIRTDLLRLRAEVADAARSHGAGVAAVATSPCDVTPSTTDDPRYQRMTEEFGMTAREQLCCGCHVHVSVSSRDEGVAVIDRIRPWLSVLSALVVNSPYWQGADTGYASYRALVWERWPSAGPTEPFGSVAGYDAAVARLLESGGILDEGMLYFDARLSARYPTVEIRVTDVCATVSEAALVAALCRGLVSAAAAEWRAGAPVPVARVELLRAARWRAARSGLSGDLVDVTAGRAVPARDLVHRLVSYVRPALRAYGDESLVDHVLSDLLARGTGADLQRASFARRGRVEDVVLDAVSRTTAGERG